MPSAGRSRRRRTRAEPAPSLPWQALYLRPLPQGQGSLRCGEGVVAIEIDYPTRHLGPRRSQSLDSPPRPGGEAAPPRRRAARLARLPRAAQPRAPRRGRCAGLRRHARHARGTSGDRAASTRSTAPGSARGSPRRRGTRARLLQALARAPLRPPRAPHRPLARRVARAGAAPALVGGARAREPLVGLELLAPLSAAAQTRRATRSKRTSTRCAASASIPRRTRSRW